MEFTDFSQASRVLCEERAVRSFINELVSSDADYSTAIAELGYDHGQVTSTARYMVDCLSTKYAVVFTTVTTLIGGGIGSLFGFAAQGAVAGLVVGALGYRALDSLGVVKTSRLRSLLDIAESSKQEDERRTYQDIVDGGSLKYSTATIERKGDVVLLSGDNHDCSYSISLRYNPETKRPEVISFLINDDKPITSVREDGFGIIASPVNLKATKQEQDFFEKHVPGLRFSYDR